MGCWMRRKELGAKIIDDIDIRYCQLLSEDNETLAEYILTLVAS